MSKEQLQYNNTSAIYTGIIPLSTLESVEGKKDKVRVWKENLHYSGFTLQAVFAEAAPPFALVEKTAGEGENAEKYLEPQYEDPKVQFLFEGQKSRVEAAAKGRHASGNVPHETLDALISATGGGQFRKLESEYKVAMVAFMGAKGIPEAFQTAVVKLLVPDVLRATSEVNRGKVDALVDEFSEANPDHATKYASIIKRIKEAAEGEAAVDLGDLDL